MGGALWAHAWLINKRVVHLLRGVHSESRSTSILFGGDDMTEDLSRAVSAVTAACGGTSAATGSRANADANAGTGAGTAARTGPA